MDDQKIKQVLGKVFNWGLSSSGAGISLHFFLNQQVKEGIISFFVTVIVALLTIGKKFLKKVWQQIEKRIMDDATPLRDWIYDLTKDGIIQLGNKLSHLIWDGTIQLWWKLNPQFQRKYYQSLIETFRELKIEGFRIGLPVLNLENVFVSLQVKTGIPEIIVGAMISTQRDSNSEQIWDFLRQSTKKRFQAYRRLAVIGPPGSGKTTLLRHLTLTYAKKHHQKYNAPKFIPVLLSLRDIRHLIIPHESPKLPQLIRNQIEKLPAPEPLTPPPHWIEDHLKIGKCLVMLDGLDEVADEQERERISQWVNQQMKVYRQTVFILTSRPHGYRSTPIEEVGTVLEVLPFNSMQVKQFIQNWYLQTEIMSRVERDTPAVHSEAKNHVDDLIERIMDNRAIADMAKNPLLVTMIATVHYCGSALPGCRVELYQIICDLLLGPLQKAKKIETPLTGEQNKSVLQVLALALMEEKSCEFTLAQGQEFIQNELERVAGNALTPQQFLKQIKEVSGLLVEKELGVYEFAHLTFQEYLAGSQLKELQQDHLLLENFQEPWWGETIRLYAAQSNGTNLIQQAIKNPTVTSLSLALDCLQESLKVEPAIQKQLEEEMLKAALESSDLEIARLAAGVKLSRRLNNLWKIDENLEIDQDYITCAEYQLFVDEWFHSGLRFQPGNATKPITGISWNNVLNFCAWLSSKDEFNRKDEFNDEEKIQNQAYYYRLPTAIEVQNYPAKKLATATEAQNYPAKKRLQLRCWHWNITENNEAEKGIRLVKTQIPPSLFEFEVITVNAKGQEIQRERRRNQYLTEVLDNYTRLDMVAIPGGNFMMGTEDSEIERLNQKFGDYYQRESPQHKVTVQPFYLSKYPITQRQWKAIANLSDLKVKEDLDPEPSDFKDNPSSFSFPSTRGNLDLPYYGENPTYLDRPVENVNWYQAKEFCDRLSQLTGKEYRLPTEAEWEYACRAVTINKLPLISQELTIEEWNQKYHQPFYFGETITSDLANYGGTEIYAEEPEGVYRGETTPVGMFPPNAFGLYDMHGNVWEWCAESWHENDENAPTDGIPWITGSKIICVVRGSSWSDVPNDCRSANCDIIGARESLGYVGFRVVCCGKTEIM